MFKHRVNTMKCLVDIGVINEGTIIYGWRLIAYTAADGNLPALSYLVAMGNDLSVGNDWPMRVASKNGHLHILKYIIERRPVTSGALTLAAENGHLSCVEYLISVGADVNFKIGCPLRYAAKCGHFDVIKKLVSNGANVHVACDAPLRWAKDNRVIEYLTARGCKL